MINNNLCNLFMFLCSMLTAVLHVQPTFAMEKEKSEQLHIIARSESCLENSCHSIIDVIDDLHGVDLYAPTSLLLMEISDSFFFESSDLYHLPQEYVDTLRQNKEGERVKSDKAVFQQLIVNQLEETTRLRAMLKDIWTDKWPERSSLLRSNIGHDVKREWLTKLQSEENIKNAKESLFKRYLSKERVLDSINLAIIKHCLDFTTPHEYYVQIPLQCSITRMPRKGAKFIRNWLLQRDMRIKKIMIDLSYNLLRWIPDELFSINKVSTFNLMNNHLCYLSKCIEGIKDHLTVLKLGNYEAFYPVFTNRNRCRTTGNIFYRFPPVIYKLTNLSELDMCSVELDEFPESEIYAAIPKLKLVNIAHNNLSIVPRDQRTDGKTVDSYGNPGSPSIWFYEQMGDFCYDWWQRLPSWNFNAAP